MELLFTTHHSFFGASVAVKLRSNTIFFERRNASAATIGYVAKRYKPGT